MIAAVAIGVQRDMEACIATWVSPKLGAAEAPDPASVRSSRFDTYLGARRAPPPLWAALAANENET
jgi:erythritol kinase